MLGYKDTSFRVYKNNKMFLYFEGLKYGILLTADTSVLLNSILFGDDGLRGGVQTGNKSKDND